MESYVIQTVMGIIGSVGFAVLFGIYDRKLLWIAVGGGAGWAVYLVCVAGGQSKFTGLLSRRFSWRPAARFSRECSRLPRSCSWYRC